MITLATTLEFGSVADHFEGVGAKYLTAVEVDPTRSNQHEIQGVSSFRSFLGEPAEKQTYPARFIWLDDELEDEPVEGIDAFCTWSDVRRGNPHRSAEYHLYYAAEAEPVIYRAVAGDLLIVAKTRQGTLLVLACRANTTIARQLLWLFGLQMKPGRPVAKPIGQAGSLEIGYSALGVMAAIGLEVAPRDQDAFEELEDTFGLEFPSTADFSEFARRTLGEVDPVGAPDETLVRWMDHEEALFRHMERRVLAERLEQGFNGKDGPDVDGFISFSLSVQNRRKSRAGWAFGHHVDAVLQAHGLRYEREARTENAKRPDFLFPAAEEYHSEDFDPGLLTMLAAKTSCKDRWRQVLSEANKIPAKHLLTLQPAISPAQTDEMRSSNLQLVVPRPTWGSYLAEQQAGLMDFSAFIGLVREREVRAAS